MTKRKAKPAKRGTSRKKSQGTRAQVEHVGNGVHVTTSTTAPLVDAYIAEQTPRLQVALRRWQKRAPIYSRMSADDVRAVVKDCGRAAAAVLLGVSDAVMAVKIGGRPVKSDSVERLKPTTRARIARGVEKMKTRFDAELDRSRASFEQMVERHGKIGALAILHATSESTPVLESPPCATHAPTTSADDSSRAVRLDSLASGATVKTPDSPSEGLKGVTATVVRLGTGSVSMRLGGGRRTITPRDGESVEFDAPGRLVQWAPSTMVVVVEGRANG